jgi:hypothetical protein
VVEAVCRAALDAVRSDSGQSARWLEEARMAAAVVLDELAPQADEPRWRWLAGQIRRR